VNPKAVVNKTAQDNKANDVQKPANPPR
jgi:hypothetical protein